MTLSNCTEGSGGLYGLGTDFSLIVGDDDRVSGPGSEMNGQPICFITSSSSLHKK